MYLEVVVFAIVRLTFSADFLYCEQLRFELRLELGFGVWVRLLV